MRKNSMWNVVRMAFNMIITHINVSCKPRIKAGLTNFMTHHHHRHHRRSSCLEEYEFSCSNSPYVPSNHRGGRRRRVFNFHCADHSFDQVMFEKEEEEDGVVLVVPSSPEYSFDFSVEEDGREEKAFSVRVSDYSSDGEGENGGGGGESAGVDDEAEEFIMRFYQQLRAQNR